MESKKLAGEGDLLWEPSPEQKESSRLAHYMRWLADERGLKFDDHGALCTIAFGRLVVPDE